MTWHPPVLRPTRIAVTAPTSVTSPADFMARWLEPDAVAVVERHAEVRVVRLRDVAFDEETTFVHSFSDSKRCDARAVRGLDSWIIDAVHESDADGAGRVVFARPGRHLCLGKSGSGPDTVMREARIRPYSLPIPIAADDNAVVEFVDYFETDDATGDLHCIAHRVIAIRSRSNE